MAATLDGTCSVVDCSSSSVTVSREVFSSHSLNNFTLSFSCKRHLSVVSVQGDDEEMSVPLPISDVFEVMEMTSVDICGGGGGGGVTDVSVTGTLLSRCVRGSVALDEVEDDER